MKAAKGQNPGGFFLACTPVPLRSRVRLKSRWARPAACQIAAPRAGET
jgi:hypothetical protein